MRTTHYGVIVIVVACLIGLMSGEARAEKKIGMLLFSEETRYVEAAHGIRDRLAEAGYVEPRVRYFVEKAGANKARAAELVKKFSEQNLDLIIALGTSATVALSREVKDVPIVFSMVYDPVGAGIATGWKSSGNNTTGSSTFMPMSKLLDCLKKFIPAKRLAVLYTTGEKNSEAQLHDLQDLQAKYRITVIPVRLTRKEEIGQLLPEVLRSVDALYITGSNLVNSQVQRIVDMATKTGVVTISHLEDMVEKGVLLGVSVAPYAVGTLAGDKAVKILKGAKPSSLPIETPAKTAVLLNMITAKKGSFPLPPEFMNSVTRKIE